MSRKIKLTDLPEFDMADYLGSAEDVAAYLSVVIAEGDAAELADALGHVAKARGMAAIAERAGIGRKPCTRRCAQARNHASTPLPGYAQRWV